MHGTRMLTWQEIRQQYRREKVELRNESRWVFLNTLFSVSEAVIYMQVSALHTVLLLCAVGMSVSKTCCMCLWCALAHP
jgi:hypothetical protein